MAIIYSSDPHKRQKNPIKGMEGLQALMAQLQQEDAYQELAAAEEESSAEKEHASFNTKGNPSFRVISTFAYLIGVEKRIFEHPNEPPQLPVYEEMDKERDARIVRNLCRIRTAMTKHYKAIATAFWQDMKNIGSLPELIPVDAVEELGQDGVRLYKSKPNIEQYMINIHLELSNRLNQTARFFPEWIKWDYIRPLFLVPKGNTQPGQKQAGDEYNKDRSRYPYQVFLNWRAYAHSSTNLGNILYNDEKFVLPLYEHNEDRFLNMSLVRGTHQHTMEDLAGMLDKCRRVMVVVDCENSDAVKLSAVFSTLTEEQMGRIVKIIFFDSERTTAQWSTLVEKLLREVQAGIRQGDYDPWTVEHQIVPRINMAKSNVDTTLVAQTMKAVYTEHYDGVMLVSSDSDFVAMVKALDHVRFLVMLESEKTAAATLDELILHETPYCLMDDFCTAASYSIKTSTLIYHLQAELDQMLSLDGIRLNLHGLMDHVLYSTWIEMTPGEKKNFYERYLQKLRLTIQPNGEARLVIDRG